MNQRRRAQQLEDDGWFPLSSDLWQNPGEVSGKLRAVADQHFPTALVDHLRKRALDVVTTQQLGWERCEDDDLLVRATSQGRMVFSCDERFWTNRGLPRSGGTALFVTTNSHSLGVRLAVNCFRSCGNVTEGTRLRITADRFFMRFRNGDFLQVKMVGDEAYAKHIERAAVAK